MNVTCACPQCDATLRNEVDTETKSLLCPNCGLDIQVVDGAITQATGRMSLHRCLICPSRELFIRKDFPQRLGILIVVVGFLLSSIAWYESEPLWAYAILFATAGLDVVLYATMGEALVCYRCNAHYRGFENLDDHTGFNLETHERYRQLTARQQQASAVAGERSAVDSTSTPLSG